MLPALISELPEEERTMETDISIIARLYFQHVYLKRHPEFSVYDWKIQAVTSRAFNFEFYLPLSTSRERLERFLNQPFTGIQPRCLLDTSDYVTSLILLAEDDFNQLPPRAGSFFSKFP
ncbi:MAG: hypothetical protein G01um101433_482 [Parcubacteria group bacterium Gr01-1014_33]|nr:MAG: hypothetical protein G01um101433_482 [Parcubacteria group bacterium Gr01-1014_33]